MTLLQVSPGPRMELRGPQTQPSDGHSAVRGGRHAFRLKCVGAKLQPVHTWGTLGSRAAPQ